MVRPVEQPRFDPVEALRRVPGLTVVTVDAPGVGITADLIAAVEIGHTPLLLAVEVKDMLDPRSVDKVVQRLRTSSSGLIPVVAARYISPAIRRRLESNGIGWLDNFGNVHVDVPDRDVIVHAERPMPRGSVPRPHGHLFGPAGSRVAQALLEEDRSWDLATLAELARVKALSTVSRALDRFEHDGLVRRESDGWIVPDRATLLDAWLDARIRASAPIIRSFFTPEPRSRILDRLGSLGRSDKVEILFTGSLAAERLVPLRAAETVDAYVFPAVKASAIAEHRLGWTPSEKQPVVRLLVASDDGPKVGAMERMGLQMVGKAQLVLDLHREGGRAIEVANELRREWAL